MPRIVFMGNPDFAVPSLEAIHKQYGVAGVVTGADKPAGRGQKVSFSPVMAYTKANNLPVLQPTDLKDPEFYAQLKAFNADIFVVVAFRFLPESIWAMPPLGSINLHASLLPDYRGAAPINWAIINGEKESGLTTFFIQRQIDVGNILKQVKIPIEPTTNAGQLHDKMMTLGAGLLLETLADVFNHKAIPTVQDESKAIHKAPKIFTEHCKIDWNSSSQDICNHIRGLAPHPGAFTTFENKTIKIFKSEVVSDAFETDVSNGHFISNKKNEMIVKTGNGEALRLLELQLEGRKKLPIKEFLMGFQHSSGKFE